MKSILVCSYNRPRSVASLLDKLARCKDFESYKLIVICHEEMVEAFGVVKSFAEGRRNMQVIPVNGSGKSAIENINNNRLLGLSYCFDMLNSEYVVTLEDDSYPAWDALAFCEEMHRRYWKDKKYRGVGLMSNNSSKELDCSDYSILRYGLIGQGGAMPRNTWAVLRETGVIDNPFGLPFDTSVERYLKSGFTLFPGRSKVMDRGYENPTHYSSDPSDAYYKNIERSFKECENPEQVYKASVIDPLIRRDCIEYKSRDDFYYMARFRYYAIKCMMTAIVRVVACVAG